VAIFDPSKLLPGGYVYCRFNYTAVPPAALRTFDILVRREAEIAWASAVYGVELKYVNSHNSFHNSQYLDSIRRNDGLTD
jgi:hypothetical protein